MKRIISILLSISALLLLAFAFSACGSKEKKTEGGTFNFWELPQHENEYSVNFVWDYNDTMIDEVKFPSTYKGKPVSYIGACTFASRNNSYITVKKVIIPSSVKYIGEEAFLNAKCVEEIVFEEGSQCSYIGKNAFNGCEKLKELILPSNAIRIDKGSFENCRSLESFSLPTTLTEIPQNAFFGCSSLKNIVIPEKVTKIERSAFGSCNNLTSVKFPSGLQTIGTYAFYGSSLTNITLPDSLTTLHLGAFGKCSKLTSVDIPKTVKVIEQTAFADCKNLEQVNFAKDSLCTNIALETFANCTSLKTVNLPNGLTSIDEKAFTGCSALTDISIPDSVQRIETAAFAGCNGLSDIRFGANSKCNFIGENAFQDCKSLSTVHIEDLIKWFAIQFNGNNSNPLGYATVLSVNGNTTDFVIPKEVTKLSDKAFENLTQLKTVTFETGSKCQSIGKNAFKGCSSLQTITFATDGVCSSIGESAFAGCTAFKTFTMPVSIKTVGANAFSGCENLTNATTNDIAAWCAIQFANAEANPVTYAKSLSMGGKILNKMEIPQGVARINAYAFTNHQALTEITLPKSLQSIGVNAFDDCRQLEKIHLKDLAAWCKIEFDDWTASPLGFRANLYMNENLLTDIAIPDTVTKLNEGAFADCYALQTVHLGKVTSIGANAFAGCSALTKVYIPLTVTKIGEYAFEDCENLTIYAQPILKPFGWHENWNFSNCPVKWGQASMN